VIKVKINICFKLLYIKMKFNMVCWRKLKQRANGLLEKTPKRARDYFTGRLIQDWLKYDHG
jgi:hypothetical protein